MKPLTLITTLLILLPVSGQCRELDPDKYSTSLRKFIENVVYRVEKGDKGRKFIRLPDKTGLTVTGNPNQQAAVKSALKPIIEAGGIELTDQAADSKAVIHVYFGTREELARIAKGISDEIDINRLMAHSAYYYWKWWGNDFVVTRAVVFVPTDTRDNMGVIEGLHRALMHVAGMPATSGAADNSLLAANRNPRIIRPTALDLKVLAFLYRAVPAGTAPSELRKIVRDKWDPAK